VPRNGVTRDVLTAQITDALADGLRRAGAAATPVRVEIVDALERDANGVGKLKLVRAET
jgi:hypothetical protein